MRFISPSFMIVFKLGGNALFKDFMLSYPADLHGGYKEGMSPYDTYHSWAAAQYREKVRSHLSALA